MQTMRALKYSFPGNGRICRLVPLSNLCYRKKEVVERKNHETHRRMQFIRS